jgi:dTDP-4-amino-4,6-dideoxygalactose transaminase
MADITSDSNPEIPFYVPSVGEEEIEAVAATLRSGWLTTGPQAVQFEEEFAAYVGAANAVACSSGTAALHLALRGMGIGPGDEVITSPYTFVASTEVVLYLGAKPVFVDIDPRTLNIDPAAMEAAVTPDTRAILPIHVAGYPCEMDPIMDAAADHGLGVLEDAAHALPASYRGRRVGSIGTATAFSFYATKNLTTGEGGMVTTDNPAVANKMRTLRLHGISGDAWKRYMKGGRWFYEVVDQGYKYNLPDIQAAMGRVQLRRLDQLDQARRRLDRRYRDALTDSPVVLPPEENADHRPSFHLFVIRLDPAGTQWDRAAFIEALRERGISTSVHFIPVHLHPYYRDMGYRRGMFPAAEAAFDAAVSLPFYPAMPDSSVDYLLDTVRTLLRDGPS